MEFDWDRQGNVSVHYDEDDRSGPELLRRIEDRYLAHHYEKGLVAEGYSVNIQATDSGALELIANEAVW